MPGTDELLARLMQLENNYYGDKEATRQQGFFDTYGSRFSNNRGLGLAILNELDARGVDTSAADEAVQEIIDTLRTDCNQILELLKGVQEQAIDNAQKVETIANVVNQEVAANPEASVSPTGPDASQLAPADIGDMEDGDFNPAALGDMTGSGEEVPPSAEGSGEEVPPPTEEVPPPTEEVQPPVEGGELPPNEVESDEREKNISSAANNDKDDIRKKRIARMKSKWGETKTQKKRAAQGTVSDERMKNVFKPSAGMLEAASRGY